MSAMSASTEKEESVGVSGMNAVLIEKVDD
jgi:hypothetical protein